MVVADVVARSAAEHRQAEKLRAKAAADTRRIWRVAERIERMTRVYQERLDGQVRDQH